MASIKEIRTHIKSVEQTLKITNAMFLISSSNLQKARKQLADVEPYFQKIGTTISDILHHSPEINHVFFDKRPHIPAEKRKIFLRRYWFADSYRDIAQLVGLTKKTVSVRLTRLREKLRQYLMEQEVFV